MRQLSVAERVQLVGILFQNPNHQFTMETLFEELVFSLENIAYPIQEIESKIAEVVEKCRSKKFSTVRFTNCQVEKNKKRP